MANKKPQAGKDRKRLLAIVAIVGIVIVASVGGYLWYDKNRTVNEGDTVHVNYIGQLPDGRVFDTSMYSVAQDNVTYPKSLFFTYRGNETNYDTLNFTVGSGTMIEGFDNGVRGMKVGETKTIIIPKDQAYGDTDPKKISTINLTETVPVQQTMSKAEFLFRFNVDPVQFSTYTDPEYHWDVYVMQMNSDQVVIQNMIPSEGGTYRAYSSLSDPSYGWEMTAEFDATGNNITVLHHLDASSAGQVKGFDGSSRFIVTEVDVAAGKATIDKNNEVVGKDLTFIVTIVSKD